MKKYLKIWLKWAYFSFVVLSQTYKLSAFLFLLGKIFRFFFFLLGLLIFVGKSKILAGYTLDQAIFFFLIFNLVDIAAQFLFRGVYWFRSKLISGRFDYALLRPINPLFEVLFGHPDPLDLVTLFFLGGLMIFYIGKHNLMAGFSSILVFVLLLFNAFILTFSLHVAVAAFGVITLEVDHLIWIYRDITKMGRIPIDIYAPILRGLLTFVVPVAVMMTFPAKALMGLLSWRGVVFSFIVGGFFLWSSLSFWRFALTRYTSASS